MLGIIPVTASEIPTGAVIIINNTQVRIGTATYTTTISRLIFCFYYIAIL